MMSYANQWFRYDHYETRVDDAPSVSNDHRRMHRTSRRRTRKRRASTPALTINARRRRRWSW